MVRVVVEDDTHPITIILSKKAFAALCDIVAAGCADTLDGAMFDSTEVGEIKHGLRRAKAAIKAMEE